MKKLIGVFVCLTLVFIVAACGSSPKVAEPPAGTESYYVRADGNDRNAGTSEDAPFKTLTRAIEVASKTSVKKITVIGTLVEEVSTENAATSLWRKNWDDPNPAEILITGKPNATDDEKAVLTSQRDHVLIIHIALAIRLENIEISGKKGSNNNSAVYIVGGELTLAQGAKITNNIGSGVVVSFGGLLIMRDNSEISNNEARVGGGIVLQNNEGSGYRLKRNCTAILLNNTLVTNNRAAYGGGIVMSGSELVMMDNVIVSNNTASDWGGGILTDGEESKVVSKITLRGSAAIINNSAQVGGGIFLQDQLTLFDSSRITGNTASTGGGGVFMTGEAEVFEGNDNVNWESIIKDNNAPRGSDLLDAT